MKKLKLFINGLFLILAFSAEVRADVIPAKVQGKVSSIPMSTLSTMPSLNVRSSAEPSTQPLRRYLKTAYDLSRLRIEKSISEDQVCDNAYFISVIVPSFWENVQVETEYYVQTVTKEAQDRLYQAITANLPTKGLPECLLQDEFYLPGASITGFTYHYKPDYTTVSISATMKPLPEGAKCAKTIERQITSCWNVQDPYAAK